MIESFHRERIISPEKLIPAAHELNHALVGFCLGYLSDISLEPDSNGLSRANTSFYGHVNENHIPILAAAGMVDTPFGPAMGYGMDLAMAGPDYQLPLAIARTHIKRFPREIRQRAAEIIAERNGMKSYELPMILAQAQADLEAEEKFFNFIIPPEELFIPPQNGEDKRTIIEREGAIRVITYVKNGLMEKQLRYCTACGQFGGHQPNCPLVRHSSFGS